MRGAIYQEITNERERQDEKWGEQNHDDYRWMNILVEEIGEAAQAVLHNEFGGRAAGTLKDELIQVAAVAVQWLECLERREWGEAGVCTWTQDSYWGNWDSACGLSWQFTGGSPSDNEMVCCPKCGRKLVESAVKEEEEE